MTRRVYVARQARGSTLLHRALQLFVRLDGVMAIGPMELILILFSLLVIGGIVTLLLRRR